MNKYFLSRMSGFKLPHLRQPIAELTEQISIVFVWVFRSRRLSLKIDLPFVVLQLADFLFAQPAFAIAISNEGFPGRRLYNFVFSIEDPDCEYEILLSAPIANLNALAFRAGVWSIGSVGLFSFIQFAIAEGTAP